MTSKIGIVGVAAVHALAALGTSSDAHAQNGDRSGEVQKALPEEWRLPPSPPLDPPEALEALRVQPGFRVELVASEPLIGDPVQAVFDASGDLWVCEMRGYMPDADGEGEEAPVGRVVRLRDTDGDGVVGRAELLALSDRTGEAKEEATNALLEYLDGAGSGNEDGKVQLEEMLRGVAKMLRCGRRLV